MIDTQERNSNQVYAKPQCCCIAVSYVVSCNSHFFQSCKEQDEEEEDEEQVKWSKLRAYSSRVGHPANSRWSVGSRL